MVPSACAGSPRASGQTSKYDAEEQFKEAAKHVLALTEKQLAEGTRHPNRFCQLSERNERLSGASLAWLSLAEKNGLAAVA